MAEVVEELEWCFFLVVFTPEFPRAGDSRRAGLVLPGELESDLTGCSGAVSAPWVARSGEDGTSCFGLDRATQAV